jgi:hypothetical protein
VSIDPAVVDAGDVRVLEPRRQLDLAVEACVPVTSPSRVIVTPRRKRVAPAPLASC